MFAILLSCHRSQILKQLRIGSSFTKHADDGRFWVQMVASMSKDNRPVLFALPKLLTPVYQFYIETVRPRLLAPASADRPAEHDYLFVKANGSAPRANFSTSTNLITQALLGPSRAINAHAFRSAVVVKFYSAGVTQNEMSVLANLMSHSVATARQHYHRVDYLKEAVKANDKMASLLLHTE